MNSYAKYNILLNFKNLKQNKMIRIKKFWQNNFIYKNNYKIF